MTDLQANTFFMEQDPNDFVPALFGLREPS